MGFVIVLLKVGTSYQGVFEDGVTQTKFYQSLRTSTSQRSPDTITKANGNWGHDFSRYQPENEVWTQPWKGGEAVEKPISQWNLDANATAEKKRGFAKAGRLILSASGTLATSFWSAFRGNSGKIIFSGKKSITMLNTRKELLFF